MSFETRLKESLREKSKEVIPPQELKQKVLNKIDMPDRRGKFKRRLVAGVIAVSFLIPTSAIAYQAYLADDLYGSFDKIKQHFTSVTMESYMLFNAKLSQAKGELGQAEYDKFKENLKVITSSKVEFGDQYGNIDYDKVSQEKVAEIKNAMMLVQPYFDKLNGLKSSKDVLSNEEYELYIDALMSYEKILVQSGINPSEDFDNEDIKPELLDAFLTAQGIMSDVDEKVAETGNRIPSYMPSFSINDKKVEIEYGYPNDKNPTFNTNDVEFINAFGKSLKPIEVTSNSNMKVTFPLIEQQDSIDIKLYNKKGKIYSTSSEGEFTFPKESGQYTIVVVGQWDEVIKPFIFVVKVKE